MPEEVREKILVQVSVTTTQMRKVTYCSDIGNFGTALRLRNWERCFGKQIRGHQQYKLRK